MKTVTFNKKTVALLLSLFVIVSLVSALAFLNQPHTATTIHASGASGSVFDLSHSSGSYFGGALGGASK